MFSLLSTAGPLTEHAFFERIATMFTGHDLPDETLVRACLESYRSPASTPDRLRHPRRPARAAARSTPSSSARSPMAAIGWACGSGSRSASRRRRDPATGRPLGELLDDARARGLPGRHQPGRRRPRRGRRHLVHPRQGRAPVRGRVDGDPRRAAAAPPCPDRRRRPARPVPRHRPRADGPRPPQAGALAAAAPGDRRRRLEHHQVGPPADLAGRRSPRPRRPRAAPRPGPGRRARRRADAAVRRADPPRPAVRLSAH